MMETIQNYHSRPEESAAEESWDYVQFQVRAVPTCGGANPSHQLWDSGVAPPPLPGRLCPDEAGGSQLPDPEVTLPHPPHLRPAQRGLANRK